MCHFSVEIMSDGFLILFNYNIAFLNRNFEEEHLMTWLDDNNYIIGIICVLYIFGVFVLHRWMKNKPPIELNPSVLPTWNVQFSILSFFSDLCRKRSELCGSWAGLIPSVTLILATTWDYGVTCIFCLSFYGLKMWCFSS